MALSFGGRVRAALAALWGGSGGVPWHVWRDNPPKGAPAVTPQTVLTLPAVMRCCSILSEAASTAPPMIFASQPNGGRVRVQDTAAARALATMTHQDAELFSFSTALVGNGYLKIIPDGNGAPYELRAIAPWRVQIEIERGTREVWYRVAGDDDLDEPEELLPERRVIHGRYRTTGNRLIGTPPIASCAPAFAAALATRQAQQALMANVAAPRTVLVTPNRIDTPLAKKLQAEWEANYSGQGLGRTAVLSNGLDVKPLNVSAVDMQLLETAQASVADVARAFGLPSQFLDATGAPLTYASASEGTRALYSLALRQFCARLGDAFAQKLLTRSERVTTTIEFDLSSVLVLPGGEMAEFVSKLVNGGVVSVNDARNSWLRLPDVEGGDTLRAPTNTAPLDRWAAGQAFADTTAGSAKAAPSSDENLHRDLLAYHAQLSAWYRELFATGQYIARFLEEHPEVTDFVGDMVRPPTLQQITAFCEYRAVHGPDAFYPSVPEHVDGPRDESMAVMGWPDLPVSPNKQ